MRLSYLFAGALFVLAFFAAIAIGSVMIPLPDTVLILLNSLFGGAGLATSQWSTIILDVRLPRVMTVALVGAALSVSGSAMQGLLRNPLADGTTLGVSAGASLGAVLAIAFNLQVPGLPGGGTTFFSIAFAFLAMVTILFLAQKIDYSMSTNTVILVGVIFSMFASSITSLVVTFAGSKVKSILFWTMGSFASSSYRHGMMMAVVLALAGGLMLMKARELNAFAIGEDNARNIGVEVRTIKLQIMVLVSALIGVSVAISGTIGFVGLIVPHISRMIIGSNHQRLLPFSAVIGATFLLLADLVSRVLLSPLELPIGVITSFVGSVVFVFIFYRYRRKQ